MKWFRNIIGHLIYVWNWTWLEKLIAFMCIVEMQIRRKLNADMAMAKVPENIGKIPQGMYCYNGCRLCSASMEICPFWDISRIAFFFYGTHGCGYCHLLEQGDYYDEGIPLLWDMCKECSYNDEIPEEEVDEL